VKPVAWSLSERLDFESFTLHYLFSPPKRAKPLRHLGGFFLARDPLLGSRRLVPLDVAFIRTDKIRMPRVRNFSTRAVRCPR